MKILATGVFDIIHIGHLHFLQKAKSLGDELIVLVSCDKVCEEEKRIPINSQEERVELVEALKPVDKAFIGPNGDKYKTILDINPDILVLGFDQKFDIVKLEKALKNKGFKGKIIRLPCFAEQSTTMILEKIKNQVFQQGQ
ncbi:MAG: adenylyltransferase/cytidyltransferase family protein [bacterium]